MVFFLAAGIYAFGGVIFLIFARGELQPWAIHKDLMDIKEDSEGHQLTDMKNGKPVEDGEGAIYKPANEKYAPLPQA